MKFRYFIFGIAFALLLGSLAYLNKSNIRPLAQPIINFIQKGSLKIENINIEAERSIIDSNNLVKSLTTNNLPLNFEYIDLNDSSLRVYLENPELIAPESSMPKINLESSEIDAIIMTLNEYSK
ncbi:hypothetical protein N9797_01240 [Gammaproteobacteria bacterium]|nr:hypothetical protein [Gammaproteobacteria bacterium]